VPGDPTFPCDLTAIANNVVLPVAVKLPSEDMDNPLEAVRPAWSNTKTFIDDWGNW
jgi:hypothetical protein